MPLVSIICGVLLILLGIAGYVIGIFEESPSLTAFIPAVFGLLLLILGLVSKSKEHLRKHLMHAAVLIGLIGFIVPLFRLIPQITKIFSVTIEPSESTVGASATISTALLSQALMSFICLVFVILSVKSFIDARRSRTT